MDYQLVVVRGRSAAKTLKLANGITTVGRQEDCQLRIGSSQVSRKHCQLFEQGGRLVVIDLGSSNGTFVNGTKIEGHHVLKSGDVLSLGKVKFRVEKLDASGSTKPADTAVPSPPPESGSSDEFEIDFDDGAESVGVTPPASSPVQDDTEMIQGAHSASKAKGAQPTSKTEGAKPASQNPGEDAVADFLINIDLDDEESS
jgi:pSer/pThr/pTyr-binding forkhead associated (FHA) protein